jgi:DNA-directed RNA polymerase specialized sigma24 family protein
VSERQTPRATDFAPMSTRRSGRLRDEFGEIFTATYAQVVRTVWFVVHDQGVAEEIAQDAFTELYRGWSRLRDYDRPDLWVRRVAIRRAQREATRRARGVVLERAAGVAAIASDGIALPDTALIDAIRTLPPKQRAIVVLFYLEDRSMAEVASVVGCTTSTGFVQLHQARKRLAAALGEEVGSDVD